MQKVDLPSTNRIEVKVDLFGLDLLLCMNSWQVADLIIPSYILQPETSPNRTSHQLATRPDSGDTFTTGAPQPGSAVWMVSLESPY